MSKTYQATGGKPVMIDAGKTRQGSSKDNPVVMTKEDAVPMLKDALMALGVPQQGVTRLVEAAIARSKPLSDMLQRPKTKDFLRLIEDRAWLALQFLDEFAMIQASPKDRALIASILLEKRQLLRGEPTQILGIEDRAELTRILPMLFEEAKSRGIEFASIDAEFEEVKDG